MIGLPGLCLAWNCHRTAVGWSPGRSLAWHRLGETCLVKGVVCTTEPPCGRQPFNLCIKGPRPFSRFHIREAHKLSNTLDPRALTTQPTHRNPSALIEWRGRRDSGIRGRGRRFGGWVKGDLLWR
ncbi:hypothetical protein LZ31DRAFT_148778 [Colletotrichum somersetense]|nr:hypothetical protein LZ31DRAFT_148778 [Colletotrichum somersetense]